MHLPAGLQLGREYGQQLKFRKSSESFLCCSDRIAETEQFIKNKV